MPNNLVRERARQLRERENHPEHPDHPEHPMHPEHPEHPERPERPAPPEPLVAVPAPEQSPVDDDPDFESVDTTLNEEREDAEYQPVHDAQREDGSREIFNEKNVKVKQPKPQAPQDWEDGMPFTPAPTSREQKNRPSDIDLTNQFEVPYSDTPTDDMLNIAVQRALKEYLKGGMDKETQQMLTSAIVEPANFLKRVDKEPAPPTYLKAYRNDRSPNIQYIELDMETREPNQNPTGRWMSFVRGFFFATTENEVANMVRLMSGQRYSLAGRPTGYDPDVYEDDGEDVVMVGTRPYVRNSAGHKAALKAAGM